MILGANICTFQFSSLYNPVDSRVRERVWKMLLMGITQRSEIGGTLISMLKRTSHLFKTGCIFLPIRPVFEFNYVPGNDSSQTFALRPRESSDIGKKSYE